MSSTQGGLICIPHFTKSVIFSYLHSDVVVLSRLRLHVARGTHGTRLTYGVYIYIYLFIYLFLFFFVTAFIRWLAHFTHNQCTIISLFMCLCNNFMHKLERSTKLCMYVIMLQNVEIVIIRDVISLRSQQT